MPHAAITNHEARAPSFVTGATAKAVAARNAMTMLATDTALGRTPIRPSVAANARAQLVFLDANSRRGGEAWDDGRSVMVIGRLAL